MTLPFLQIQCGLDKLQNDGGHNMIYDLFINGFGAVLGILGAIALWLYQNSKYRKDKLIYVASLLESTIAYAKTIAAYCGTLADKLNAEPTKFNELQIEANYDLKRLADKLDQEAFYHSYLKTYKREKATYSSFKEIYSEIDFIDHSIDQIKDFLEKEYISITDKKKSYVSYLEDGEEKAALLTVNPKYQGETALLDFLNTKLVEYKITPHDDTDLNYPYTAFIDPVLTYLTTNYSSTEDCNTISVLLRRSAAKLNAVNRQGIELAKELKAYQQQLILHADKLKIKTENLRADFKNGM